MDTCILLRDLAIEFFERKTMLVKRRQQGLLLLLVLLLNLSACATEEPYEFPVLSSDVQSITFCYLNEGIKMEVTKSEDIATIISCLSSMVTQGEMNIDFPEGSKVFVLEFHMLDDILKKYSYIEVSASNEQKYFSDDQTTFKIKNCNLAEIWDSFQYEVLDIWD